MKKIVVTVFVALVILGGVFVYYTISNSITLPNFFDKNTYSSKSTYNGKKYIIKKAGKIVQGADTLDEVMERVIDIKRCIAINTINNEWVYSDLNDFLIIDKDIIHDFDNLKEAVHYANTNNHTKIHFKNDSNIVWINSDHHENEEILQEIKESNVVMNVKLINQYPELPRGCEVTSLAMILDYAGVNVSKMKLAQEVKKDTTRYEVNDKGRIIYGNPYDGFVGDMYNLKNNGYGVYHGPLQELAEQYVGDRAVDLTGVDFDSILYLLSKGYPILVITNAEYRALEDHYFQIWHTPTGIVKTTNKLHSVVVTGMSGDHIYINDPLSNKPNRKLNMKNFRLAWEQMGNQAIVILD